MNRKERLASISKITEKVWPLSAELLWSIILHAESGRCEHSTKEQSQKATLQLCSNGPDSALDSRSLHHTSNRISFQIKNIGGHHYRCYWSYAQHKKFCCSKRDILHMAPSNKVSQLRRQSTLVETLVVKISCEDDRFLSCVCQASEGDALFCRDRSQKLLCLTSFRTSTAFITNLLCCSKKSFEVDDGPREGLRRRVPSVFCKWERPQVLRLSWIRALPRNVFLEVCLEKLGVLNPPRDAGLPKDELLCHRLQEDILIPCSWNDPAWIPGKLHMCTFRWFESESITYPSRRVWSKSSVYCWRYPMTFFYEPVDSTCMCNQAISEPRKWDRKLNGEHDMGQYIEMDKYTETWPDSIQHT